MNNSRDNKLSYLRAIACVAIVILHTTYIANITFTESYSLAGNVATNSIRNLMLWAVPNFVMITGALSLTPAKEISLNKIFTKYVTRIFLALVIFCVIYQVFDSIMIDRSFGIGSIFLGIKEALLGDSWLTMWYLYQLIGLYLLLPIYRIVTKHAEPSQLKYMLLIYWLFMSIFPIFRIWGTSLGFTINLATIYPFYFFAGYTIYNGIIKVSKRIGLIMFIAGSLLTLVFTFVRYIGNVESFEMFRDYNGINVVVQSLGAFVLMFGEGEDIVKLDSVSRVLLNLDANSFGIYLIHIVLIKWLFRVVSLDPYTHGGIFAFLWMIPVILIVSWGITFILRLIPPVRKIL